MATLAGNVTYDDARKVALHLLMRERGAGLLLSRDLIAGLLDRTDESVVVAEEPDGFLVVLERVVR